MTTDSTDRDAQLLATVRERYEAAADQHRNELAERIERRRKQATWAAEIFNLLCPPGTRATLTDDLGAEHPTKTRSVASVSEAGIPTVMVEGRTGGYLLWRIKPFGGKAELWDLLNKQPDETLVVQPSCGLAGFSYATDKTGDYAAEADEPAEALLMVLRMKQGLCEYCGAPSPGAECLSCGR
jgi:hypothetical protein